MRSYQLIDLLTGVYTKHVMKPLITEWIDSRSGYERIDDIAYAGLTLNNMIHQMSNAIVSCPFLDGTFSDDIGIWFRIVKGSLNNAKPLARQYNTYAKQVDFLRGVAIEWYKTMYPQGDGSVLFLTRN